MHILNAATSNLKMFGVLLALMVALGLSIGIGLSVQSVFAEDTDTAVVHACYAPWGKIMRYVDDPADCAGYESVVNLGAGDAVVDLIAQVNDLQTDLDALALQVPDCLSEVSGNAVFSGCDVHVNNGEGSTATKNGTGNLIVGYNENLQTYDRTGSHNIVVGIDHGYSEYGGLVVGASNQITGTYSSVSGGFSNEASGLNSSVSGGAGNTASGSSSNVSGGSINEASAITSSVGGGAGNTASGARSSVNGGTSNDASGPQSSVSGGQNNLASGIYSSISGGEGNMADEDWSSIGGDQNQNTTAQYEFLP